MFGGLIYPVLAINFVFDIKFCSYLSGNDLRNIVSQF